MHLARVDLGRVPSITVPAGGVFTSHGPITGDITKMWHVGERGKYRFASFITTAEVRLSKKQRCQESSVRMYVDDILNRARGAKAPGSDYWMLSDFADYKIGTRPPIEFGQLLMNTERVLFLAELRLCRCRGI